MYDISSSRAKFPKRRQRLVDYTIGRLEDKSSFVRANAIKLLTKFVETHPFVMDGGELQLSFFEKKYAEVTEKLEVSDGCGGWMIH
jgi:condensin complex subunit 1